MHNGEIAIFYVKQTRIPKKEDDIFPEVNLEIASIKVGLYSPNSLDTLAKKLKELFEGELKELFEGEFKVL